MNELWDPASLLKLAVLRSDADAVRENPQGTRERGEQCVAADEAERKLRVRAGLSAQLD